LQCVWAAPGMAPALRACRDCLRMRMCMQHQQHQQRWRRRRRLPGDARAGRRHRARQGTGPVAHPAQGAQRGEGDGGTAASCVWARGAQGVFARRAAAGAQRRLLRCGQRGRRHCYEIAPMDLAGEGPSPRGCPARRRAAPPAERFAPVGISEGAGGGVRGGEGVPFGAGSRLGTTVAGAKGPPAAEDGRGPSARMAHVLVGRVSMQQCRGGAQLPRAPAFAGMCGVVMVDWMYTGLRSGGANVQVCDGAWGRGGPLCRHPPAGRARGSPRGRRGGWRKGLGSCQEGLGGWCGGAGGRCEGPGQCGRGRRAGLPARAPGAWAPSSQPARALRVRQLLPQLLWPRERDVARCGARHEAPHAGPHLSLELPRSPHARAAEHTHSQCGARRLGRRAGAGRRCRGGGREAAEQFVQRAAKEEAEALR
jgi:hypothetical protein